MKILILGGTRFLGRHLVGSALRCGHEVTLFHRGLSGPAPVQEVESILGDRATDLDKLRGRSWDRVIDTCGYLPRIVKLSAEALKDSAGSYVFISSISVYADFAQGGVTEEQPVGRLENENIEEITGETYGPLKALCERAVQAAFPRRALIIRPGLIVGPYDPTDRFTYWPVRVARGGTILTPEGPQAPVQFIDGRDLADFTLRCADAENWSVFHVTGPEPALTLGKLLESCKEVSGSRAVFKWASTKFLEQNQVEPWSDLPAWTPSRGPQAGFSRIDISKAVRAGLSFLPLEETIRDTLVWANTRPADHVWQAGLDPRREEELLALLNNDVR